MSTHVLADRSAATVIVEQPGLDYAIITVRPDSTVATGRGQPGANEYLGITVDGRFYPLVMTKHLDGREELGAAVQAVVAEVRVVVALLAPTMEDRLEGQPTRHTVTYGPEAAGQMERIVGRRIRECREIDQCVHTGGGAMQAFNTYVNPETGKVFKVICYGIAYDAVLEFASEDAYRAYVQGVKRAEPDPETGRPAGDYYRRVEPAAIPDDETLIADAGGPQANPYTSRIEFDEIQIRRRATGEIVASCGRFDAHAQTMTARAYWLRELRAR